MRRRSCCAVFSSDRGDESAGRRLEPTIAEDRHPTASERNDRPWKTGPCPFFIVGPESGTRYFGNTQVMPCEGKRPGNPRARGSVASALFDGTPFCFSFAWLPLRFSYSGIAGRHS